MKNGHNDMLEPIGAIPFLFSTSSFLAHGFSTLRFLGDKDRRAADPEKRVCASGGNC
jgi:hypothetical protein